MLDSLVLIACVCIGIATVFYIFYWNRLVAALLGLVIRFFYWSQGASSIWVHIGSIQLSLLSGRIFLKDVRYHSSNQTVRIVKVQIIWKYWLRRPLSDDNIDTMFGAEDGTSPKTPSCRIQISLQGYEWFLYNRTAAFDNILSQMASRDATHQPASKRRQSVDTQQSIHAYTPTDFGTPLRPSYVLGAMRIKTPTALQDFFSWFKRQLPNLDPKELLPIGIDITKGVILCGNNSTPNLMVAEFENGNGTFGITQSRSKFDLYKQMLTLTFRNVLVQYLENKQYGGDTMPVIGEMIRDQAELSDSLAPIESYTSYQRFGKLWRKLGLYTFFGKYVNRQTAPKHHGHSFMRKAKKSLDEGTPIGVDFTNVEYAIERKILSTPSLELCYYADAAGEVPPLHLHTKQAGVDAIGNGDAGPEWGVDMIIRGGYLRYGPWADRQRGELQRAFFPPNFNDVEETPRLQPGDERLWTHLRMFIELRDDTTLHIPFREASKTREHAVIRLVAGDQSSVCYTMPMIAGPKGYEPTLEVHLDTVAVTSSLNDIRLISAESCRVRCDLPSPLKWNASRTWDIAVSIRQPILYLLRDHVNMFVDLGKDWASGPPNDFFRFIPTVYTFQLDFHRFELNLYVNDHNIIDKPLVRSDNAFAILRGTTLHHSLTIPSNVFRATETTIPFIIDVPDASISLSLPKWHTHALHSPAKGIHIGTLNLHLDGSYRYFSTVQDDNVEQLKLSFVLKDVAFKAIGWSIRYFMILRENYFGSFTHFSTLYEYLERRGRGLPPGDPDLDKYRAGTSNMMQVVLVVRLENVCIILPAGLPGYDKPHVDDGNGDSVIGHCLILDLPELHVYLRLHDFLMDLAFNVAPISARVLERCPEVVTYSLNQASEKAMVLIDGIDITANRLFGPVPRTIQLGSVRGSLSASDAFIMSSAISAFRLNFTDAPNAPASEYMPALYPDITFVKISLESLDIVWKAEDSAIHISLPSGLRMDNNNLGGKFHRTLTSIRIPTVSIKVLSNVTSHRNNWLESASISTDVSLDIYTSPAGWRTLAEDQLNFVDEQDALTGRAAAMFQALWGDRIRDKPYASHRNGVHIPQPLPSHSSRFTARGRHRGHEQGKWHSPPLSESEDERLPEAERDARLAKTRSEFVSPVREVGEDGDMSGADESDNGDVTDEYASYSSDWSDSENVSSDHWHYSRFARHYGSRSVDSPSLWDLGPFFLTKDYKVESSLPSETFTPLPGSHCTMPENDIEVTVFRIFCRNDIDIRITPLTISAISHFLNDLEKIPFAPELSIDGMVASYLSSLPNPHKTSNDRNIIDVDISSAHLHLVRRLDHVNKESTGVGINRTKSFAANCQEIGFQFSDVLLSLDLHGLAVSSQHRNVQHALPEYGDLQPIMKRREQFLLENRIRVVRETIVDPLSAIQPSYLIQSDPFFRFLFHLRDCLWDIENGHGTVDTDTEDLDLESLIPLLEERLLALDPDSYHLSRLTLLEPLFPELRKFSDVPEPSKLGYPFASISLHMKRSIICVIDPSPDVEFSGRIRFHDFIHDHSSGSQLSLARNPRRISSGLTLPHLFWIPQKSLLSCSSEHFAPPQTYNSLTIFWHHSPSLVIRSLAFHFSVPRSALRLYRFYQDWRNDFIPGVESAMREIVVELKQTPDSSTRAKKPSRSPMNLQINGHVQSFGILLQVMHGTWISWELRDSTFHFNSTSTPRSTQEAFGIQVASQTFTVSPKADSQNVTPNSRVKLDLPSLSVSGRLDGQCIKAIALIEFLDLKVKPSHWDTLMAVQQKFGHDFNDFLSLIQETRSKQATSSTKVPKPAMKFIVSMKIRGFRIGLEGLSSTRGLDTTAARTWFVTLSDLALSLASRTSVEAQTAAFSRSRRSAFEGAESQEDTLQIRITKIHAIMQPSSMGQVGDFIDDMQTEMLIRQEQRAHELAAFKQKTQKIFESFEVKGDVPDTSTASLLDSYSIDLSISNVGVAFPLIHDDQLNLPQHGSHDGNSVRAFLFSIASIQFGTVRGVTGEASMKRFSFQFVHRFRQSVAADFSGETHSTRNRLVYPEMTAFLRSTRSPTSRQISMKANVSGFILDLDSTIPDYVFSLIDVYRQGKERVEQLSQPKVSTPLERPEEPEKSVPSRPKGPIPTSTFCGSLDFLSGKVRTYSASASQLSRAKGFDRTDDEVLEVGGEVFNLPGVSVWMEYRATPASHKFDDENEEDSSLLMFKSTVHSSQNTLRPTLLPFFTELVSRIEHRMRQSSPTAPVAPSLDPVVEDTVSPRETSSMQISFSLRIDQSKLELTCKPDVNVVAALHWDSGGFVVNVSPGARNVTFTGSVGGLTIGLRHGFLSEDCVSLDARNLAFSVGFSKLDVAPGRSISTVSLILDTEFLGGVRFSRLQDVLCFKAVWLDRIPMFNGRNSVPDIKTPSKIVTPDTSIILSPSPQPEYSTVLLIRIRQIKLDVDLGQSISTIVLDLRDSVLRTKLTESINEVSLSVGDVSMTARGNIGGKVHVGDCVFQTIRRIEQSHEEVGSQSRMLELRMTSGPFIVALESEHQKAATLPVTAEPLAVEIFDDWSQVLAHPPSQSRPLRLSFTIVGPEIVAAATIGTIPQILSYVNKFKANLEIQRDGASRDSKTFRSTRAPQPDNPLSAVAEAMIHSARSRIQEATDAGLSYIIRQHMSLRLDLLRLVVFPRSMDDVEAAQIVGRNVRARLDRLIQSGEPSKRDISLSFTGMTISRLSQLGHTVSALQFSDNNDWLNVLMRGASEATIVGLPSMKMHMVSEETQKEGNTVLQYDFDSSFLRLQGKEEYEDIYIALNVGLYSWLAVLRKTLTREMEQVKAASEWMNALSAPTNISSLRRKGPDVIGTFEAPRSAPAARSGLLVTSTTAPRSASSATTTFSLPPVGEGNLLSVPTGEDGGAAPSSTRPGLIYLPRQRHIERLNMRQLGEATPNVMHPFFMKKAGFSLEDSLPQYVNEYATTPLEEIMEVLLKLYSRQLLDARTSII
ncbi:hypothetical protein BDZ89DRAFT_1063002 [Hymenopellis radicata]|nr:hypothetical protein BDZ89DRAFT_1063002 [Hymenopellis radicata]